VNDDDTRPDVSVGEIHTRLEVTDGATPNEAQLRRLIRAMIDQRLREDRNLSESRDDDLVISDRAWRSSVKRR
jgi:hypothetical protein